jgi:transposase
MDGFPIPVAHGARSFSPGWLADIARMGKGGNDRYCYGVRMMMVINQHGVATGWALASGNVQERWVAELLFSTRAGMPRVQGPLDDKGHKPKVKAPKEWMATVPSGGAASTKPILSDGGFRGDDWLAHWAQAYGAQVCPRPKAAPRAQRRWLSSARQVVETTFANLSETFGLKYPGAHTTWGLLMRVSAKVAAYNLGIMINRLLGRPDFAFATLIV